MRIASIQTAQAGSSLPKDAGCRFPWNEARVPELVCWTSNKPDKSSTRPLFASHDKAAKETLLYGGQNQFVFFSAPFLAPPTAPSVVFLVLSHAFFVS